MTRQTEETHTAPSDDDRPTRLWYLTMELPVDGHASHTHVMGIIRGLQARGWSTKLWQPQPRQSRGAVRRLVDEIMIQLRLMTTRHKPDLLYVRGHFASLPAVLWAKVRRVPVAYEVNGPATDVLSSWPQMRRLLPLIALSARIQVRLSSVVIAVTPELSKHAATLGGKHCFVVPNGADTEVFSPAAGTDLSLPPKYICFVGTLATWQGIDTLLEALTREDWPPDVSLVVVGDGVAAPMVRDLATTEPRLQYLGRIAHASIPGVLAASLAATSPKSARDHAGTGVVPLKLFEAMACGVPVIVTRLPGQADIVEQSGCGIVIPADDAGALAAAVKVLAADRELASEMGRRSREEAVAKFSWDAAAAQTHEILLRASEDR